MYYRAIIKIIEATTEHYLCKWLSFWLHPYRTDQSLVNLPFVYGSFLIVVFYWRRPGRSSPILWSRPNRCFPKGDAWHIGH